MQLTNEIRDNYPLVIKDEINRNTFFHLRKELVKSGCPKEKVLQTAQQIYMDILQINELNDYLSLIPDDTYEKCKLKIDKGVEIFPVQDPNDPKYSINSAKYHF